MKRFRKLLSVLLSVVLILSTFGGMQIQAATKDTRYSHKYLQNGSFEDNVGNYNFSSNYTQPQKIVVPYWDTTAYNTDGSNGKMEFFKKGAAHFNRSSAENKDVADGDVAAELNADEVSTIYQRIETVSGSTYTWGLDHRGRDTTDTMVLFIGPEQYDSNGNPIDPSKPSKNGPDNQDQFVKMTNWLKKQYGVTYPNDPKKGGCSQKYTIYSKPFAEKGGFQNGSTNEDENFSMTKTDECNQEWSLWVISSVNDNKSKETKAAVKGWSKYGTNCYDKNDDKSYDDIIKGAGSELGYDCTYTVPKGQTNTLFAFTSYSGGKYTSEGIKYDATYGNLLDDINFKLYQPISSSITNGGSGGVEGGKVTVSGDVESGKLFADVTEDGKVCKIYTAKSSNDDKYKFVGAYITETLDDGTESTRYVSICHHDLTGLTKEEIEAKHASFGFVPYNHDGNVTDDKKWDYYFVLKVNNPVHIHMIYTKAPYVIYDSNGGLPYQYGPNNESGDDSVAFGDGYYTGGPETESYYKNSSYKLNEENHDQEPLKEKGYYYSHIAYDNPNWVKNSFGVGAKFVGWSVLGKDNNMHTFDANHKIEYMPIDADGGSIKIFNVSDADKDGNPKENANVVELALDENDGVTLTAQWKFGYTAQAQTLVDSLAKTYENSDVGGWVEETFIDDRSNVTDHKADYTPGRTERTDAYGSVGSKIIFRATPDSGNNYVFDGWYIKEADKYKLVTAAPNLAITVEEGNSTIYYARFKTKTVPVIFHYSESGSADGYDYYETDPEHKYGKYFQEVVYNEKAIQPPTNLDPKVTMWFTSPTERDQEHLFSFSTPITEQTDLYASPAFNFNYFNHLTIKGEGDPINPSAFSMITYATLKLGNDYVDLKNDSNASDYNIYLLKGELGDSKPLPSDVKKTQTKYKKGSGSIVFNSTTTTAKSFNRAGVKYDYLVQTAGNPLWVVFDFTYKGITYTTPVINRSMYNQLSNYHAERKTRYYTTYPKDVADEIVNAHTELIGRIQALIEPQASSNAAATPTVYADFAEVDGLTVDEASTSNDYTFASTTAVRNIEPWGFKYTFSVNEKDILDFDDYGAVVLTDSESRHTNSITVNELINDSDSVMFSLGKDNVYLSDDEQSIEVYYVNNIGLDDFDKNTFVVFFVKDDAGYHYSNIISNTYNDVLESDVDNEFAPLLINYQQSFENYTTAISDAEEKYGKV